MKDEFLQKAETLSKIKYVVVRSDKELIVYHFADGTCEAVDLESIANEELFDTISVFNNIRSAEYLIVLDKGSVEAIDYSVDNFEEYDYLYDSEDTCYQYIAFSSKVR